MHYIAWVFSIDGGKVANSTAEFATLDSCFLFAATVYNKWDLKRPSYLDEWRVIDFHSLDEKYILRISKQNKKIPARGELGDLTVKDVPK